MDDTVSLGRRGEELAASLLLRDGYRILARNWRSGRYELDLVGIRDQEVAFVEVKTRRPGPQPVEECVSPAQRRHIGRAAAAWMRANPGTGRTFRFDVVVISWPLRSRPRIRHIPDAFDATGR
jgi:putative endonuclease